MPSLLRGPQGLIITVALAAAGAVVAAGVLFTSSRASNVNLTSAGLAPADAGVYVALNTDLASSQWVEAFKLSERLGAENPEDELKDGAEESGLDWDDDIAPFLGGNAAIYVKGLDIDSVSASGAVILRAKDAKRAMDVIEDEMGSFDEEKYHGVEYLSLGFDGYVARIDDHLVIAFDEESIEEVIDVHQGRTPSLASVDDFQRLRDELTGNFLAFVYVDASSLFGDFLMDDPALKVALEQSGASDMVMRPAAWVIGAKAGGFEFQAASIGDGGKVSRMIEPRTTRFAALVPGETAIFFSTTGIAQTWESMLDESRDEIDQALRESSPYDSLDEMLEEAGAELGIESIEDLIALLEGETAVAAWFPRGNTDEPEVVVLAEVNEAVARPVIEQIIREGAAGPVTRSRIGNVDMTVAEDEDGEPLAYAFKDGYLAIGTPGAVEGVLKMGSGDPSLAELQRYRDAVAQMPTALGTFGFFNLAALLRLEEAPGIPEELDAVERALGGAIINWVEERGVVRLSGVVTIEE